MPRRRNGCQANSPYRGNTSTDEERYDGVLTVAYRWHRFCGRTKNSRRLRQKNAECYSFRNSPYSGRKSGQFFTGKSNNKLSGLNERRRSDSNRCIKVLQTSPLPLGYGAIHIRVFIITKSREEICGENGFPGSE